MFRKIDALQNKIKNVIKMFFESQNLNKNLQTRNEIFLERCLF